MRTNTLHSKQAGIVSILTVLMFSVLVGVLLTGFARIMLQEQQDTLQDDLSKSAYNSAQAGIEDAKRALRYCALNPNSTIPGGNCSNLYTSTCPGFNAGGSFTLAGVAAPTASGTAVGAPGANQRYTCVTISRSTDIQTTLGGPDTSNNTAMYKLSSLGGQPWNAIEVSWHQSDGSTALPSVIDEGLNGTGNLRSVDWNDQSYPAVLRLSLLEADDAMTTVSQKHTFMYPTSNAAPSSPAYQVMSPRTAVRCSTTNIYTCTQTFVVASMQANRYILVQPYYKGTNVSIKLKNGTNDVPLGGNEQVTVDATGAASNVFRRVQVRLSPGNPIATSTALDVGQSICKDFFVSPDQFDTNPTCQ